MVAACNVAGVDQPQPLQGGALRVIHQRTPCQHKALEVGPRRKAMLARQARLRVVQPEGQRRDGGIAQACGGRQRVAKARQRLGLAVAVASQQVLGLFLEMAQVGPRGNAFHESLRAWIADGPQLRQHKG
ncbi:MAG: hypothetical protein EON49_28580 [Acidovorax sp.]|nr:MAG: hypothetical protein EON49_28580 [Acidovorax sp.]